jgi:hypothetical protein
MVKEFVKSDYWLPIRVLPIVFILIILTTVLHEVGHYLVSFLFYHVGGQISFGFNLSGFIPNGDIRALVHYGGGLFVCIILLPLLFIKASAGIKFALYITFGIQLITGIWEGIIPYVYYQSARYIISLFLVIIIIEIPLLLKWHNQYFGLKKVENPK